MISNTRNTMVSIKSNIIGIWYSVIRPTSKQTFLDLKLRKKNLIFIYSSILTTKMNIKQTAIVIYSRNINLTKNNILRSLKSSKKLKQTQFAQP